MVKPGEPADPTRRFSSRVADYTRYRPGYPPAVLEVLEREGFLSAGDRVADVGSGTGLLAELFLRRGHPVVGVEPNRGMREAGAARLAHFPGFSSVDGRAEATGLGDRSVDLVVAGQAFHWFDAGAARVEFTRILREPPRVLLVWNDRRTEPGTLMYDYDALLREHGTDYEKVDHRRFGPERIRGFFGPGGCREHVLPNRQVLDREGLAGRLMSSSYVPGRGEPGHRELLAACHALFERYRRDDRVTIEYDTRMYLGTL